jgi:pre-mRNA-splicing factor CWC22
MENEKRFEELKKDLLGEEEKESEGEEGFGDESDEENVESMQIKDETETNLVNLRRTIYLTIMSSVDFEEAGHKLLKIHLEPGQEVSTVLNLTFVSNVDKSPVDCLVYVVSIVSSYTKPSDSNTCIL